MPDVDNPGMADGEPYRRRSNPVGFENSSREVLISPQQEQQITDVYQLIRPDQTSYVQSTGKADTKPGPDLVGDAKI